MSQLTKTNQEKLMEQFEEEETEKDLYKCVICASKLNGKKKSNLTKHLKRKHRDVYAKIVVGSDLPIKAERLELLQNLVEIVTLNGRPFAALTDSGLQAIIQKDLQRFHDAGCGLSMSNPNLLEIKQHLHGMSKKIRNKIKKEVANRPLSLLVDIVTKNRRSIFGLSVQFIVNGRLKVRSIGMIELLESHTAVYLASVLFERFRVFEIQLKQIFSITTDSGRNVLKMVRDVDKTSQEKADEETETVAIEDTDIADQIQNLPDKEETDEEAILALVDAAIHKKHEDLLAEVCAEMQKHADNVLWDVPGIKCAAHMTQLVIKNSIQQLDQKYRDVIDLSRRVARALRLESVRNHMKNIGKPYKVPRIEVDTRWGTLYLMVRAINTTLKIYSHLLFSLYSKISSK